MDQQMQQYRKSLDYSTTFLQEDIQYYQTMIDNGQIKMYGKNGNDQPKAQQTPQEQLELNSQVEKSEEQSLDQQQQQQQWSLSGALSSVKSAATSAVSSVVSTVKSVASSVGSMVGNAVSSIGSAIGGAISSVTKAVLPTFSLSGDWWKAPKAAVVPVPPPVPRKPAWVAEDAYKDIRGNVASNALSNSLVTNPYQGDPEVKPVGLDLPIPLKPDLPPCCGVCAVDGRDTGVDDEGTLCCYYCSYSTPQEILERQMRKPAPRKRFISFLFFLFLI
jgi:hypothetical protein